jgi:hypothetical protein
VTRIPELEQELVAAAARLQSPRRLVRPAARAALAVGVVVVALVLAVVLDSENDSDRRLQPAGTPPEATVSAEQKIEQVSYKWARLFAASDPAVCKYMSQPACEREACVRVPAVPIPNCTLPSPAFRLSFRNAIVKRIVIRGDRAAVRFSNGKAIELFAVNEHNPGDDWWIGKFWGNAGRKFFKPERRE